MSINEDMDINAEKDTVLYTDDTTGITYIYDGIRGLIPIRFPQQDENGNLDKQRSIGLPDNFDKENLARQDAEREEQIKREQEEAKKLGKIDPDDDIDSQVKDLGDLFNDQDAIDELVGESENIVRKEKSLRRAEQKAAEKNAQRYNASNHGIEEFKQDIKKLIAKEVAPLTKASWGRLNKKAEGSGVMKAGKLTKKNPKIPRLRIYYDQSWSWTSDDIKVGNQAISELRYFEKKKLLKIEVRYFSNTIHLSPDDENRWGEGGTGAGYLLMEDIAKDRPENVMVMTDSDFDWYSDDRSVERFGKVTVSGGVFLLFKRGQISRQLIDNLHGKKFTKSYAF